MISEGSDADHAMAVRQAVRWLNAAVREASERGLHVAIRLVDSRVGAADMGWKGTYEIQEVRVEVLKRI